MHGWLLWPAGQGGVAVLGSLRRGKLSSPVSPQEDPPFSVLSLDSASWGTHHIPGGLVESLQTLFLLFIVHLSHKKSLSILVWKHLLSTDDVRQCPILVWGRKAQLLCLEGVAMILSLLRYKSIQFLGLYLRLPRSQTSLRFNSASCLLVQTPFSWEASSSPLVWPGATEKWDVKGTWERKGAPSLGSLVEASGLLRIRISA